MTPQTFLLVGIDPGLRLLPSRMDTPEARALLLAIALQESGLAQRRQLGGAPARGFTQFEPAGIRGVLAHKASSTRLRQVCERLDISANVAAIHRAVEFCDPLCVVLSRLLLWTLPNALPTRDQEALGWQQYLDAWRPGKPRPYAWRANWVGAWAVMEGL